MPIQPNGVTATLLFQATGDPSAPGTRITGTGSYQAPSVVTPLFAEFMSGRSAFSAAAAEVLQRFTGSDQFGFAATIGAGSSRIEPRVTPAQDVWDARLAQSRGTRP